ncbi:unnamed protein product [Rotaria magnacalcarata]
MYQSNIDDTRILVNTPHRGSSVRSKLQVRTSQSSTLNRSLHRTLSNESTSSSISRRPKNRSRSVILNKTSVLIHFRWHHQTTSLVVLVGLLNDISYE